ncbi:hypothetical protein AB8U03_09970 [Clostridium sp. Mt-5]|uniref:DUF2933 domain-containing protein n=1 Tax=Clostridium moutaii TaxID=3240932 RepID=A0ABV4BP18_9CLOT
MNNKSGHSGISHMLMMVLCCAIPIILVASLPFLGLAPRFKIMLAAAAPFICPIMMLLMVIVMFMHSKKNKCCNDMEENKENTNVKKVNG